MRPIFRLHPYFAISLPSRNDYTSLSQTAMQPSSNVAFHTTRIRQKRPARTHRRGTIAPQPRRA
jgi:hypothetical protein